jgi:hypothetical protein
MFYITRSDFSMHRKIKVGFCIAYDWPLLEYALPCVYADADVIWISIDSERRTWAGNSYSFDHAAFYRLIKSIDTLERIKIYEDNFYRPEFTAGENEVRQRNLLAEKMGNGGWHIQIDCDEYFLRFSEFVKYLHSISRKGYSFNVCCPLITLFKQVNEGFLYIMPEEESKSEYIQIATLTPNYKYGRRNGDFNFYTNFLILHQSWARSEEEIHQKIANWGHNKDFNQEAFLRTWQNLNASNYQQLNNFHPINPQVWWQLRLNKSAAIGDLLSTFVQKDFPVYSWWQLAFQNSLLVSRLKSAWKRFFR